MREIKFRAWNRKNKRWLWIGFSDYAGETHEDKPLDTRRGNMYINATWLRMDVEFTQFTGLFDRNGREIYEGDILRDAWSDDGIGVVEFYAGAFDPGFGYRESWPTQMEDSEIIGNIYEILNS